ncbi:unnamed protein product [Larinioides sclopetarius]|uniref:Uncharacterized protein n=2 Tax=Larinioides sclopetarius TaxID=280406 RepID=A0AAV2ASF5_9ARAC
MVDVSYRWRKPLLLMYNDNYRYGTNLYVPVVNSLDHRTRDYPIIPQYIPTGPAPLPKVPLAQYDLYAPVSYGYGRNLLKPRIPEVPHRSRISSSEPSE